MQRARAYILPSMLIVNIPKKYINNLIMTKWRVYVTSPHHKQGGQSRDLEKSGAIHPCNNCAIFCAFPWQLIAFTSSLIYLIQYLSQYEKTGRIFFVFVLSNGYSSNRPSIHTSPCSISTSHFKYSLTIHFDVILLNCYLKWFSTRLLSSSYYWFAALQSNILRGVS